MSTMAASRRPEMLARMTRGVLDVLVVGGGVTGVGVALDAASRGLRVGIVERDDWASGTSSRSSKMIHGGLRYLATGDVSLVREALRERAALSRNAPHLVRPMQMLLPTYGRGPVPLERLKLEAGLAVYDILGAARLERHAWLSNDRVLPRVPNIDPFPRPGRGALRGALAYFDAQADDVRLVLAVLRTAVAHGVVACNGTEVVRLLRSGGRVRGAVVRGDAVDGVDGARDGELEIEARMVVNAAGVWADRVIGGPAVEHPDIGVQLLPSKGIHLTVDRERVGLDCGIAFFERSGSANVFVEPWGDDLAFVGTTDMPYHGDLDRPEATEAEVQLLLGRVNPFLRTPLRRSDVICTWAGLRPLVVPDPRGMAAAAASSREVSRRHVLLREPGMVTMVGGKLTTYRSMAEHTVDAIVGEFGRHVPRSRTAALLLDGAMRPATPTDVEDLATRLGVERRSARQLLRRYGSRCDQLAALVAERPELAERLHPDRPSLAVEAVWGARAEQARSADDVLQRRTRLALETRDRGEFARGMVDRLLEHELGASDEAGNADATDA